jgi:hypothetical protein
MQHCIILILSLKKTPHIAFSFVFVCIHTYQCMYYALCNIHWTSCMSKFIINIWNIVSNGFSFWIWCTTRHNIHLYLSAYIHISICWLFASKMCTMCICFGMHALCINHYSLCTKHCALCTNAFSFIKSFYFHCLRFL